LLLVAAILAGVLVVVAAYLAVTLPHFRQLASVNDTDFTYHWSRASPTYVRGRSGALTDNLHLLNTANDAYWAYVWGTHVYLYATVGPQYGQAGVSLDGGPETIVDMYRAKLANQVLLFSTSMFSGRWHRITVRMTGTKNSMSSGYRITADRIDYGPPPKYPTTQHHSHACRNQIFWDGTRAGALTAIDTCVRLTGTFTFHDRKQDDGDYHLWFKLDPSSQWARISWAEVVARDQTDFPCGSYGTPINAPNAFYGFGTCSGALDALPPVGAHVSIVGPWVHDSHGYVEVHPAIVRVIPQNGR
jgi:hypothetical protein